MGKLFLLFIILTDNGVILLSLNLDKLLVYKNDILKLIDFDENLHSRVSLCGLLHEQLTFRTTDGDINSSFLTHDFLCDFKFCPVCNAYKSSFYKKQIYDQVKKIMDNEEKHLFFMTLTVPNCQISDLSITLDKFQEAYKGFRRNPQISQFKSYVRTLEITFNEKKEAHPHYHILFLADKYYFSKKNKNYIDLAKGDLKKLWASHFLKDKNSHINVDFRKAVKRDGYKDSLSSTIQELAKYMTKSADFSNLNSDNFQKVVAQTFNKRNISASRDITLKKIKFSKTKERLFKGEIELNEYIRTDIPIKSFKEYLKRDYGSIAVSRKDQEGYFNFYENSEAVKNKYKSYNLNYAYQSELETILAKNPKLKKLIKSRNIKNE